MEDSNSNTLVLFTAIFYVAGMTLGGAAMAGPFGALAAGVLSVVIAIGVIVGDDLWD